MPILRKRTNRRVRGIDGAAVTYLLETVEPEVARSATEQEVLDRLGDAADRSCCRAGARTCSG